MKTEDTFIKNEGTTPEHLGNKVFVGGLPLHVDKDALQDFFSCFGPVTDVSSLL
jgi:RNA-binding protein Musashi